ncbi:MAG: 2-oxoisovalerate dehydrogenase [Blastocatellia bacterium AA13]|nr:MAG: 2-oxoisovalerate dehydrogenase [Blastocatellia bacterium AA13]
MSANAVKRAYKPFLESRRFSLEERLEWYRLIHLGRLLDDRARTYSLQGKGWSYHASHAGHDGIQVALGLVFRPKKDYLFSYYRDMLTCLAAGVTPEEIILNGLSKAGDRASGGRHMSNHFAKIDTGIWNVSSATGNHTQHAAGLGRAVKYYGSEAIVFCSQGESSCSEGYVFEALNGASRERLPVVFVIQNNGYGISVPVSEQTANAIVSDNYRGLSGLSIINCDGTDPFDSVRAITEATDIVRMGRGPVLIHAECERINAHSNSDKQELYRSDEELARAQEADTYLRLRLHLLSVDEVDEEMLARIEDENKARVAEAVETGESSPDPDPSTATHYVTPAESTVAADALIPAAGNKLISLLEAINTTLKHEFRRNDNTFIWGQDVASKEKGGVFGVTKGMQQEFGPKRVFNAPIAENYIIGTANGFSRFSKDIWVVVEAAQFADYVWPGIEQIVDTSHDYYRSNGQFVPNIVMRLASGGYIKGGLYHSQNLEALFTNLPGLRVVMPAFADDAVGLLRHAMRSRGVTMYLEPKYLYNQVFAKAPDPGDRFEVPFGKARIRREGDDLTIISYGTPVHWCLRAAEKLKDEAGVEAEVIDLRSLLPLDTDTIFASVRKTSKALVVHEDKVFSGFGAEVAAQISEYCFGDLDGPVARVGSKFAPVPFSRILESEILPQEKDILEKALALVKY